MYPKERERLEKLLFEQISSLYYRNCLVERVNFPHASIANHPCIHFRVHHLNCRHRLEQAEQFIV